MKMLHVPRIEYPSGILGGSAVSVNEYIPGDKIIGVLRNRKGSVYSRPFSILFFLRDGVIDERLLSPMQTAAAWASGIADELEITLTKVDVSLDTNYQYARLNLDMMVAAAVGGTYQYMYFPPGGSSRLNIIRYTGKDLLLPTEKFIILPAWREEMNLVVKRSAITSIKQRDERITVMAGGHELSVNLTLDELVERLGGAANTELER